MDQVVGVGEYHISKHINDVVKTYALATCVGVTLYDPVRRVMGMIHVALPTIGEGESKGRSDITRYADSGMEFIIDKMFREYGCMPLSSLQVGVYGAVENGKWDMFSVSKRNVEQVKKVLLERGLRISIQDTGGEESRTLYASVATGEVIVIKRPMILRKE